MWLRKRVPLRVPVMGRLDGVIETDGDGGGGVVVEVEVLTEDDAAVESLL